LSISISRRYWRVATRLITTPKTTSAMPNHTDSPPDCTSRKFCTAVSSRRKMPKRATTNPKPIRAMPVRIHASSVRSAA
jgi:hypothetical protein